MNERDKLFRLIRWIIQGALIIGALYVLFWLVLIFG
jgi:hypothetical protein